VTHTKKTKVNAGQLIVVHDQLLTFAIVCVQVRKCAVKMRLCLWRNMDS